MPRNFFRRIELAVPIEDGVLRERIISEILAVSLADNARARFLQGDGSYRRAALRPRNGKPSRSQVEFIALAEMVADPRRKPADGKTKFPQIRLAPSPFATGKRKRSRRPEI